jgi:hypothetical protein
MSNPLDTICDLKWNYPIFGMDRGEFRSCCRTPTNLVTENELQEFGVDAFLNSPKQRQERLDLIQGRRTEACVSCWKLEDSGIQSPRHHPKQMWWQLIKSKQVASSEYSDEKLSLELSKINDINHPALYSYKPYMLEISMGNTCDLKCMYCSHHYSTQWATERIKYHEITQEQYDREFPRAPPSFDGKFWEWFNETGRHSITRLGLIGGEPLIMPEFYTFMDKVIASVEEINDQRKEKITLWIVSNFNTPPNYLQKVMQYLPKISKVFNLEILGSMESVGDKAEYIRNGVSWERFTNNIDTILSNKDLEFDFGFIMSVNALNVTSNKDFIAYTKQLYEKHGRPVILKQNLVSFPSWQSPMILSQEFIPYIQDTIQYLNDNAESMPPVKDSLGTWSAYAKFLETIIDGINNQSIDRLNDRKKFPEWFDTYDTRRGLKLTDTFPEYENFYNMCKSLNG